jgi:chaperone modulatory protein CbpM
MPRPSRPTPGDCIAAGPLRVEIHLTAEQLATAVGLSRKSVARLVRVGLLEPSAPAPAQFSAATAARLRRMLRLHHELGVNLTGAAIIVDLVQRLDELESGARAPAWPFVSDTERRRERS